VAAILIPLPSAIDDHQTFNAKNLSDAGAGISLVQKDVTAAKLAALLLTELANRDHLLTMAEKAQQLAKPFAATQVADICEEVARGYFYTEIHRSLCARNASYPPYPFYWNWWGGHERYC